jgi:hypothetical protein
MDQAEQAARRAREFFDQEYLCGESVLLAVAESRGLANEWIPRAASGFCSGLARTGGLCGALSGGILAINLVLGRGRDRSSRSSPAIVPSAPCLRASSSDSGRRSAAR